MLDTVLFVAFPYLAVALAVVVGVMRYFGDRFSYSSQSSQLLGNGLLLWGSVPWHYGILPILVAHLAGAVIPGPWAALLDAPIRLYVLEIAGMALALMAIAGIALLAVRRLARPKIRAVTTAADGILLATLLVQAVLGLWVALAYRWGSQWYLYTVVPWLVSLATFQPQPSTVAALPLLPKLHFLVGTLAIAIFPFTRLVHLVTLPITYLWRPYQVVIWNWKVSGLGRPQLGLPEPGADRPDAGTPAP
jgi:nitrate reductase gamma subunit